MIEFSELPLVLKIVAAGYIGACSGQKYEKFAMPSNTTTLVKNIDPKTINIMDIAKIIEEEGGDVSRTTLIRDLEYESYGEIITYPAGLPDENCAMICALGHYFIKNKYSDYMCLVADYIDAFNSTMRVNLFLRNFFLPCTGNDETELAIKFLDRYKKLFGIPYNSKHTTYDCDSANTLWMLPAAYNSHCNSSLVRIFGYLLKRKEDETYDVQDVYYDILLTSPSPIVVLLAFTLLYLTEDLMDGNEIDIYSIIDHVLQDIIVKYCKIPDDIVKKIKNIVKVAESKNWQKYIDNFEFLNIRNIEDGGNSRQRGDSEYIIYQFERYSKRLSAAEQALQNKTIISTRNSAIQIFFYACVTALNPCIEKLTISEWQLFLHTCKCDQTALGFVGNAIYAARFHCDEVTLDDYFNDNYGIIMTPTTDSPYVFQRLVQEYRKNIE